jgi:hypothetical protein
MWRPMVKIRHFRDESAEEFCLLLGIWPVYHNRTVTDFPNRWDEPKYFIRVTIAFVVTYFHFSLMK